MMKLPKIVWVLAAVGALTGCGSDALEVEGRIDLVVRQAGQAKGAAGFAFPANTVVDAPPGIGRGIFGRCFRQQAAYIVELDRADNAGSELQRVGIRFADTGASMPSGGTFVLGSSTFQGTCTTASATKVGESVRLSMTCTGLQATADARTVDAQVNLTFQNCEGESN